MASMMEDRGAGVATPTDAPPPAVPFIHKRRHVQLGVTNRQRFMQARRRGTCDGTASPVHRLGAPLYQDVDGVVLPTATAAAHDAPAAAHPAPRHDGGGAGRASVASRHIVKNIMMMRQREDEHRATAKPLNINERLYNAPCLYGGLDARKGMCVCAFMMKEDAIFLASD